VFVHKSLLRRCGVEELQPGQRVLMKAVPVDRGREATWLSLL
jgi:CspA family cold shock protein